MTYIPPYYKGMGTRYKTKKSQTPVPPPTPAPAAETKKPEPAAVLVVETKPIPPVELPPPAPEVLPVVEETLPVPEEIPEAKPEPEPEPAQEEVLESEETHSADDAVPNEIIEKIVAKVDISDEEKEIFVAYMNLEGTSKGTLADIGDRMGITLNKKKMNKTQMMESIKSRL